MFYCIKFPAVTVFCVFLYFSYEAKFEISNAMVSTFCVSIGLAAFCAVIFNCFASIVEFSTDAAFYCMSLEAESGQKRNVRLKPLHAISEKHQEEEERTEDSQA